MKASLKLLGPAALLVLGTLWTGCSKDLGPTASTDQEAIQELLFTEYADWVDITEAYDGDSTEGDAHLMSRDTLYGLVAWWRRHFWNQQIRDLNIHIENDSAWVTLYREIPGRLNLIFRTDTTPPETLVRYTKSLTDYSERHLLFVRTGPVTAPHRGWELRAISNVEVTSQSPTLQIDSLRITGGEYDTVVTDPLVLQERDKVFAFPPGTPVTLTLYVNEPENAAPYLHHPEARHRFRRRRFQYEDGHFVGTWTTPITPGVYHTAVDVLHRATLITNDYPYDAHLWLFVYRVVQP